MATIESRLKKLEAVQPRKDNELRSLPMEELYEGLYQECKAIHESGAELNPRYALLSARCREFSSDEHWVMDRNHRLSVFMGFYGTILELDLPNQERVEDIIRRCCRCLSIESSDIDWLVTELTGVDMGEETPWLKGYLEHSGES